MINLFEVKKCNYYLADKVSWQNKYKACLPIKSKQDITG
jgi:hypothetical protein